MYCLLASNPKKKKRMKEAVWGMDDLRGCGKRPSTRQRSKSTDERNNDLESCSSSCFVTRDETHNKK